MAKPTIQQAPNERKFAVFTNSSLHIPSGLSKQTIHIVSAANRVNMAQPDSTHISPIFTRVKLSPTALNSGMYTRMVSLGLHAFKDRLELCLPERVSCFPAPTGSIALSKVKVETLSTVFAKPTPLCVLCSTPMARVMCGRSGNHIYIYLLNVGYESN